MKDIDHDRTNPLPPVGDFRRYIPADIGTVFPEGQCRKSGEPYIIHPLWVGIILAELELDKETIVAGILHDVVEDTEVGIDEIRKNFGEDVESLVAGHTEDKNMAGKKTNRNR